MAEDIFAGCKTIMWYDQYVKNYYDAAGFRDYTLDAVMRDLDAIDADVYAIYATNQWGIAYYDSDVFPKHPSLGERDYFGEVVGALKERGKKVIAYTNWLDSRHPEWHWRRLAQDDTVEPLPSGMEEIAAYRPQGKGPVYKVAYGRWFTPCINSPRREEILRVAREIVERYPVDAFHLDMFFNTGICLCDSCRPHLEEMLGTREITYRAVTERWGEYLHWRQEVSTSLIAELADIAHGHGVGLAPNAFCPIYLWPTMAVSPGWWPYLASYVTEAWLRLASGVADTHSTTIVAKWLRALGMPGMVLVTGQHPRFSHAPLAEQEYRMHASSLLGNGGYILGSCGQGAYPSTGSSQAAVETMGLVFADYKRAAADTDATQRETVKHVAVIWSQDTRDFYEPGEDTWRYRFEFLGYCRALLENHRLFDIVVPERIRSADDLAGYELVILGNVACMEEPLAEAIRGYVAAGGQLLATANTGLCDRLGRPRERSLLEDVLGVRYVEPYPFAAYYWSYWEGKEPSVLVSAPPPAGTAARVQPTTAESLAALVEPDPDYPDSGSGVDLVPGADSAYPLFTCNRFGQGTAWYLAGSLGYAAYSTGYHQTLAILAGLLDGLAPTKGYQLSAPITVELSMETDAEGTLYAHLTNQTVPAYLPGREITRSVDVVIPVSDVRLRLYGPIRAEDVEAADGLSVNAIEGGVECHIHRLHSYGLITVRNFRG